MEKQKITFAELQAIFGKRLTACFEERNIKQSRFAKDMNVSESNVSRWKNGSSFPKTIEDLYNTADYFNVSIDYLLGRTEKQTADMEIRGIAEYTGLSENAITAFALGKEKYSELYAELFDEHFIYLLMQLEIVDKCSQLLFKTIKECPKRQELIDSYTSAYPNKEISIEEYFDSPEIKEKRDKLRERYDKVELAEYKLSKMLNSWVQNICPSVKLLQMSDDTYNEMFLGFDELLKADTQKSEN